MKLLVVTSYPEQNSVHSDKTVGVASYTKTLLTAMHKTSPESKITVLSEVLTRHSGKQSASRIDPGQARMTDQYTENSITVERVWRRGNLKSLFSLLGSLKKRHEKNILVSFEVYMFGSPLHNLIALLGLTWLRLSGKKITTVVHQVLGNPRELEKNPLKAFLLTLMKAVLYRLLLTGSTKVVVFEEQLKTQLPRATKVVVIPHLIPEVKRVSMIDARNALGLKESEFYALYFGYLSPYKGLEELLTNYPQDGNTKLIVAGGANPNHTTNSSYMEYVKGVEDLIEKTKAIGTGFVPEEKVALYFSASDVLVLPYTTFMSSSGPLSLALAYELPILLSEELAPYGKTKDIATALHESGLTLSDITFKRTEAESIADKLQKSKMNYTKLTHFSRIMREKRSEATIAQKFWEVLK